MGRRVRKKTTRTVKRFLKSIGTAKESLSIHEKKLKNNPAP